MENVTKSVQICQKNEPTLHAINGRQHPNGKTVTDKDGLNWKGCVYFISYLESDKKAYEGLFNQMQRCLRNNSHLFLP